MSAETLFRLARRRAEIPPEGPYVVRQFRPPIRRWRLAAWWDGLRAVLHQVRLLDYLGFRLRKYSRRRPQVRQPFPAIEIRANRIEVKPSSSEHPLAKLLEEPTQDATSNSGSGPHEAELRFLRRIHEGAAQAVLEELQEAEEEAARVQERLLAKAEELDRLKGEHEDAVEEGRVPSAAALERSATDRGRPRSKSWFKECALLFLIVPALIAEFWGFASAFLNRFGVDVTNLAGEWSRNRLAVLLGCLFSAICVLGVVSGFHFLLQRSSWLFQPGRTKPEIGVWLSLLLALSALLGYVVWVIAGMRTDLGEGAGALIFKAGSAELKAHPSRPLFAIVTFLIAAAVAAWFHKLQSLLEERQKTSMAQREWDLAQNPSLELRNRQLEMIRRAETERADLAKAQEAARSKIRSLNERIQDAEQWVRHTVEAERRLVEAFVNSCVAALEMDRYYFTSAAKKRQRADLLDEKPTPKPQSPRPTPTRKALKAAENGRRAATLRKGVRPLFLEDQRNATEK